MATASTNPPKFRWSTDPPGKPPSHTIAEATHKTNVQALVARNNPAAASDASAGEPLALPVDTTYLGQEESLRNQRDRAIAASRQGRDATLLGYGYSGTFDPNSDALTGGLTFDPTNAFSKAALLKQKYDIGRSSAAQTMGSRGGLYQGAFQNQQDLVNRGQLQAEDALQTSLTSWLANNAAAIGSARTAYETGVSAAAGDAANRAANLQNANYSPTVPAAAAATGATGGVGTAATRTPSLSGQTLTAGPRVTRSPGTRVTTRKTGGKTVTHTTRVTRA